jgi:AraC-like DNA-binding protein
MCVAAGANQVAATKVSSLSIISANPATIRIRMPQQRFGNVANKGSVTAKGTKNPGININGNVPNIRLGTSAWIRLNGPGAVSTARVTSDRVQIALAYAKEHLSAPLSVDALANAAFLSPRQFSRLFREETGWSPAKAIEGLRVESARLMMEAGRFSAEEIARKNGFGNRERMRRSFVRAFGQPPQAIQRTVSALVQ